MPDSTILTVQQICLIPARNFATGIQGTLFNLKTRVSSRTGKPFYTGKISDATGQINVTFFRNDIDGLEGRKITIQSDEKSRGIRCDRHKHKGTPEITIFKSAHIAVIDEPVQSEKQPEEPTTAENSDPAPGQRPAKPQPPVPHPSYPATHLAKQIGWAQNNAAKVIGSLILANSQSMPNPIEWVKTAEFKETSEYLHNHFLHQIQRLERAFTPQT